ncbi:GntR family transcriptional regulator [Kribbella sp. NPDC059898]|uniref:GntR family transcriptional regulator n=1 Tax=Kribbella sp. NPDC059898 TaxID=3346995 RepID=UPI00365E07A3
MAASYTRVADEITAAIVSGQYAPGDQIPTIREIADRYEIALGTAQRVVATLHTRGLVYTSYEDGKRGVRVRSRGRTDFTATDLLRRNGGGGGGDAFTQNAARVGRAPSVRFSMVMRVPPADVAQRLGLAPDEFAVERTTIQLLDGEPWSRERSWYPADVAKAAGLDTPHNIGEGTHARLKARGFPEIAHRDEVTDELANAEDATDLEVAPGATLLVQTRTAATADRVTRVSKFARLPGRNRLIWEIGAQEGLDVIRNQLAAGADLAGGGSVDAPASTTGEVTVR